MVMEEMWDLFSARFFASLKYIRGALFAFALFFEVQITFTVYVLFMKQQMQSYMYFYQVV